MKRLTVKQVAEQIGVSRYTVINLIHAGELEAFNAGGLGTGKRYRIDQTAVDRWIESRKVAA